MKHLIKKLLASLILSMLVTACSDSGGGNGDNATVGTPIITKVTADNYMNGRKFCETYKNITEKEFGRFVKVPVDYSKPEKGSIEIYAYTVRAFDPSKPTYIFVDGGPGQNTHDVLGEYTNGKFNEMRFDQRGLGCSAPETYAQYSDASLYGTLNTINDMEAIRKAYGISKWTAFGISYGTVASTLYASQFSDSLNSVVLEGVFGKVNLTHDSRYKAEKLNIVLSKLNAKQRVSFDKLMNEDSEDNAIMMMIAFNSFYADKGMRDFSTRLNTFILADGTINRAEFQRIIKAYKDHSERFPHPQQPGAVDENVLTIIYCKDLGKRDKEQNSMRYSSTRGFYTVPVKDANVDEDCTKVGVSRSDEQPYKIDQLTTLAPTYYFQGSHDGATMAKGAIYHWQHFAKGKSYFMLAEKGGHNPNLDRLETQKEGLANVGHRDLFIKALQADNISNQDIENANKGTQFGWKLYLNPTTADVEIAPELEGIQRLIETFAFIN